MRYVAGRLAKPVSDTVYPWPLLAQAINGHRYDHLRGFKVGAAGAIVPAQRNPFDTGSL